MKKQAPQRGFFDEAARLEQIAKKDPLAFLTEQIDWEQYRSIIESAFTETDVSKGGRPSFDRLMMFKILVLAEFYGLSDDQIEYQLLDRLSFQRFIGQGIENKVPDAKTIWLFRQNVTKAKVLDLVFQKLAERLIENGLVARKGSMIDASFVKVPVQRNSKEDNETIKAGQVPEDWSEHKRRKKDTDADWTQKNNVSYFGYKQHVKADVKSKLVTEFEVSTASVHDSQVIDELLDETDRGQKLFADSAYYSAARIESLREQGIVPGILEKGKRNRSLTKRQNARNYRLSKRRCRIEHVFAWLKSGAKSMIRGVGIERITGRVTLRLIGYNMWRGSLLLRRKYVMAPLL